MKTKMWILKTDFLQSRFIYLSCVLFSLAIGFLTIVSIKSKIEIEQLSLQKDWNADLIVMPKGMNLDSIQKELEAGTTKSYLPDLLFKTSLEITNNQLKMMAFLPIKGEVMIKTNSEPISNWINKELKLRDWKEQDMYQTPEWGNKLMAGMLVSGDAKAVLEFKNIIDKKTVAQAVMIKEAMENKINQYQIISKYLFIIQFGLIVLMITGLVGNFYQLQNIFKNWSNYLFEVGFDNKDILFLKLGVVLSVLVTPFSIGMLIGGQIQLSDFFN